MALIKGLGGMAGGTLAAILSRILTQEAEAWFPSAIRGLVKLAVSRLPENQQTRFQEEWHSHVDEVPGNVGRLLTALGFLVAAHKIDAAAGGELIEGRLRQLAQMQDTCSVLTRIANEIEHGTWLGSEQLIAHSAQAQKLRTQTQGLRARGAALRCLVRDLEKKNNRNIAAYRVLPTVIALKLLPGNMPADSKFADQHREIREVSGQIIQCLQDAKKKTQLFMNRLHETEER